MSNKDKHTYLNLNLYNDSPTSYIKAELSQNFGEVLINDPSQYHVSVVRFQVPGTDIPLLSLQPYFVNYPASNNLVFEVTFTYGTTIITRPLVYVSSGPEFQVWDPSIYHYQQMLIWLNSCFSALTADMNAIHPALISTPPVMSLNLLTDRFELQASAPFQSTLPTPVKISMNSVLYNFFPGILFNSYTALGVTLTIPASPFKSEQTLKSLNVWSKVRKIILVSNLPTKNEYLNTITGSQSSGVNVVNFPILTDFNVELPSEVGRTSQIIYVPTAEYRRVDMVSQSPINNIQIQFYWTDISGKFYPLNLGPKDNCSLKLLFEKKVQEVQLKS